MAVTEKERCERRAAIHISKKTGFTKEEIVKIIQLYEEYLTFLLIKEGEASVPHIVSLKVDKQRKVVETQIDKKLRNWLFRRAKKEMFRRINSEEVEEVIYNRERSDDYKRYTELYIKQIRRTNLEEEICRVYTRGDLKFLSFLKYLQQDFPYEKDWKDEASNRIVSFGLVREKLRVYSKQWPKEFKDFQLLWVGAIKRKEQMRSAGLNPEEVMWRWKNIVNVVLLMIEHPDIVPAFAEEFVQTVNPFEG